MLKNGQQRQHDYLYWEFHEKKGRVAIRKGNWKSVRYDVSVNPKSLLERYDLTKDPGETHNVAEQNEGVIHELDLLIAGARTTSPVEKSNFPTD